MSLKPTVDFMIPEQTVQVAQAVFPQGNPYLTLRDELGPLFRDEQFAALYAVRGQPAEAPWRLALATLMQFAEGLTDRQAADAVRSRIDWKYALGLALCDPGFHYSVLCEFRSRLLAGQDEQLLFEQVLQVAKHHGLLKERSRQRSDSTHIVAAVRRVNRVELVAETLYHVLDVVAQVAPDWLKGQVSAEWYERYGQRPTSFHLPKSQAEQVALAVQVGKDGRHLFEQMIASAAPAFLRQLHAIETLRQIWLQNFYIDAEGVHWRSETDVPASGRRIVSPYDVEARFCTKRETQWHGYKVHLTETCESDTPNLITQVETTVATEQDNMVVERIHAELEETGLLPSQHVVDAGYLSAQLLVNSQETYGVEMLGPVRPDVRWQSQQESAFAVTQFSIDWDAQVVVCPMGKTSCSWHAGKGPRGKATWQVQFAKQDCRICTARERCTRSKDSARTLTLHPRAQQIALTMARQRQTTPEFQQAYAIRSGIEGTIGQTTNKLNMRRSRYRGLNKTHLQHLLTAAALNLKRLIAWLDGVPRSQARRSHFAALAPA